MFPDYIILSKLSRLERKIGDKNKLEIGDPDFIEYYRLIRIVESTCIRDLINQVESLEKHYDTKCQEKVIEVEREKDALKKRLEEIAGLEKPYLPE